MNQQPMYYGYDAIDHGGVIYGAEKLRDILFEWRDMNYEEAALTEECWHSYTIDIDYPAFLNAEAKGNLLIFTARKDGVIIGNIVYILGPYHMVKNSIKASDMGLYIKEEHRKGGVAIRLMRYAEAYLKNIGVHFIIHGHKAPSGGMDLDKFFKHQGYKPYAVDYVKELAPLESTK